MRIKRSAIPVLAVTAIALAGTAVVSAAPASAATVRRAGITVALPSTRSVYNGGKVPVRASAAVAHGVQEQVLATTTTAYAHGHQAAKGRTVHLRAGKYMLAVLVSYRSYSLVTRHRTVSVYHPADEPDGSRCTVTAAHDDGFGDVTADQARCTNSSRPGQSVVDTDPYDNNFSSDYGVGQTYTSDYVDYPAYRISSVQAYPARVYRSARSFTTRRVALTVRDAGHRRVYSHSQSHNTGYVSVPKSAVAHYHYNCADFGESGNWIVSRHQKGHSVLDDSTLSNVIRHSGSGRYHFPHAGTFRFEVITECDWTLSVYWR